MFIIFIDSLTLSSSQKECSGFEEGLEGSVQNIREIEEILVEKGGLVGVKKNEDFEWVRGLEQKGVIVCLVGELGQICMAYAAVKESLGDEKVFKEILCCEEEDVEEKLRAKVEEFGKQGIYPYEMCMISGNAKKWLIPARKIGVRTVFNVQDFGFKEREEKGFQPDIDMISFAQLESAFQVLHLDNEVLKNIPNFEEEKIDIDDFYGSLPSSKLINVGIVYLHEKNPPSKLCKNGLVLHSENIKFSYFHKESKNIDLVIHKSQDFYGELYEELDTTHLKDLEVFCEERSIPLIDHSSQIVPFLYRSSIQVELQKALSSEEFQTLSSNLGVKVSLPPFCTLKKNPDTSLEQIMDKLEENKVAFPIVVKKDRCFVKVLPHEKYFTSELESFRDIPEGVYQVESLIPHFENSLMKCYCLLFRGTAEGECIIRTDYSIPNSYFKETVRVVKNNKSGRGKDIQGEVEVDQEALKKVCFELNKQLGISIAGYDFIVSLEDPKLFYLIDLNYFSILSGCGQKRVSDAFHKCIREFCA
ncbi:unnamed protein product [Moneuplotes crassus]|uniref:Uncharacterized protein n=1 Tax=Euplotes crassus TaxID=5936 RepID=A0AAD1X681_EUPCR|nr:unnamed protein product [Moneuplotes crassus]